MSSDEPANPYAPPKVRLAAHSDEGEEVLQVDEAKSKWKTVVAFGVPGRAIEALKLLETAKIECRVLDDGTAPSGVAFHWVRSNPLGGHLVQVHPSDLAQAARILGVSVDPDDTKGTNPHDERMKKALLMAFFGAFLCPAIAHLGSLVLILATPGQLLTNAGRKMRRWAVLLDLVVLGVAAFLALTDSPGTPVEQVRKKLERRPDPDGLRR